MLNKKGQFFRRFGRRMDGIISYRLISREVLHIRCILTPRIYSIFISSHPAPKGLLIINTSPFRLIFHEPDPQKKDEIRERYEAMVLATPKYQIEDEFDASKKQYRTQNKVTRIR